LKDWSLGNGKKNMERRDIRRKESIMQRDDRSWTVKRKNEIWVGSCEQDVSGEDSTQLFMLFRLFDVIFTVILLDVNSTY
jgi:hypothetical protein